MALFAWLAVSFIVAIVCWSIVAINKPSPCDECSASCTNCDFFHLKLQYPGQFM